MIEILDIIGKRYNTKLGHVPLNCFISPTHVGKDGDDGS